MQAGPNGKLSNSGNHQKSDDMFDNVLHAVYMVIFCFLAIGHSVSADYPVKSIRLLAGFPPGGNVDIQARLVAQKMAEFLGQPVVVDNRSGAGGIIAADLVAKAAPDGYTLLVASGGHLINPALYKKLPYDTERDFAPISIVAYAPHFMVASAALPVSTVKDLISLAKAKPGQLNYGSGGTGSATHLEGELFKSLAGVDMVHVPYKGVAFALTDLVAGRVQVVFCSTLAALPFIKSGKAKAIAVVGSKRVSIAPEVPTAVESGMPRFVVDSFTGVLAPAGTSAAIINRLNATLVKFSQSADVRETMASQGAEAAASSPRDYAEKIVAEVAQWKKIVKEAGIPVQ